jgi:predicted small secreted protein
MATIGISVGLSYILPESVMAKTNIQKYEILKAMTEMDDIAHQQRETVINALGSGYNMQRDRLFQVIDNEYHKTKNIDDKILAAEKFHELMIQENELLQKIGKGNPDQIKKCDQLQKEMDQIINN